MGANPLPVVVPCHRVVESDGGLGGFGGGLEAKRRLLVLEGCFRSRCSEPFPRSAGLAAARPRQGWGMSETSVLAVSEEVREALAARRAVVALESTILAHGLPRPRNLAVGEELEALVRAGALFRRRSPCSTVCRASALTGAAGPGGRGPGDAEAWPP